MNAFTIDDVLSWGPCNPPYTPAYIKKLFAGRKTINEFDVDALPISQRDKGWGLGHMLPWADIFVFPKGVTYLWVENNPGLTELVVPKGVTYLWVENNPGLTELVVSKGVTSLWVENNPGLTELTVPEGVTDLRVLNNPALTELVVPKGVTYLWVVNNPGLKN